MKKENTEIKKEVRKSEYETFENGDLDRAIERIHQQYGNDLQAFFRDTREAILKRNASRNERDVCLM